MTLGLVFQACQKEFLEKKPDQKLLVPKSFSELQAVLDNNVEMNSTPYLAEVSSDDIYTTDAGWLGADKLSKNSYLWLEDLYEGSLSVDWDKPYVQIFYANIVLEFRRTL
jgi:hypothetical protein